MILSKNKKNKAFHYYDFAISDIAMYKYKEIWVNILNGIGINEVSDGEGIARPIQRAIYIAIYMV